MFSITTIASSTTRPVASVMPNSVSVLIEKPSSLTNANVPISDTGMVIAGISVVRQFWRNRNMTSTTSAIASSSVVTTSRIDSATTVVVSKATSIFSPGGKRCDSRLISAFDVAIDLQRVRGRQLQHAEADGVAALIARRRRVALGAELDAADVLDAHQRAVGRSLQDDVLELRRLAQASRRAHADLERLPRRAGAAPTCPAATWTFCSRSAATTSSAVMLRPASLSGSSQSRIA